jgi:hypothetical protein
MSDRTYGGSSKVAATFHGVDQDRVATPTRERVEAYEKALGDHHAMRAHAVVYPHGCGLAVAAARVEAAEVDRLTETLNRVRALADEWSKSTGVASFVAIGSGLGQLLDGPAPADPDKAQP